MSYANDNTGRHEVRVQAPPPPKKRRWLLPVLVTVMAVVVLAVIVNGARGAGVVSGPPAVPADPATIDPGGVDPAEPAVAAFGQRYTWGSGVALEVKLPEPFKPSRTAIGRDKARTILITTTIINGSDRPYEFNPAIMGPNVIHNGEVASQVIDAERKVGTTPMTTVRAGSQFTYKTALSIGEEPAELQLEYTEMFGGAPALFVGNI